ncbi:hypothetical protein ACTWP6_18965 [Mycobacterium sp. 4D054]|uniref:hypothetical protein n=1 Tax=Mycobacterium sp. 4D054 TaxID=3457440 RepID=UPI003FCF7B90
MGRPVAMFSGRVEQAAEDLAISQWVRQTQERIAASWRRNHLEFRFPAGSQKGAQPAEFG